MNPDELAKVRAKDRLKKIQRRKKMKEDQKEKVKAIDRENTARKRKQNQENAKNKKDVNEKKKIQIKTDLPKLGIKRMKQLTNNCRIQKKIETKRSKEEKEDIQTEKVEKMREKRMTDSCKILARQGMREHRKYGFLREYKQRKRRDLFNPSLWTMEPHPISEYFAKVKEVETQEERKEELRRMNRIRVERHRLKVKRMVQEPVFIENNGEKGAYELLREKNIKEFEILKKKSGLF